MKNKLLLMAVLVFMASQAFGQFYFSASPGMSLNGASFGYKTGKFVPYAGLQMLSAKLEVENNNFDYTTPGTLEQHINNTKVKANIFIPTLGAKYFIVENNKLKAFLALSLTKPIISAKVDFTYDGDPVDEDMTDQIEQTISDIKIFGGEFGFGVEYFFDDNFSVGGEFGIRYINTKFSQENEGTEWDGITDVPVTYKTDVNLNVIPTFTKVSLNFYFGGNKAITID
jgi:hypothetical protein